MYTHDEMESAACDRHARPRTPVSIRIHWLHDQFTTIAVPFPVRRCPGCRPRNRIPESLSTLLVVSIVWHCCGRRVRVILACHIGLAYRGLLGGKHTAIVGVFTIVQVGSPRVSPLGLKGDPRYPSHRLQEGDIRKYGRPGAEDWCIQGKGEQFRVHTHCLLHAGHVFASVNLVYLPHLHATFLGWYAQ